MKAVIDELNLPRCGNCNELLDGIIDYRLVEVRGTNYTEFIRRCNKCGKKSQYCVRLGLDYHERISFNDEELKEVFYNEEI